jgi:xanthine dehydrogenase accessory factor
MVTVLDARGSVPRETGARLVILPSGGFYGTIGGGTLEWQALAVAQKELKAGEPMFRLREFALGPQLGQCCGGSVKLAFEYFDRTTAVAAEQFATSEARGAFCTVGRIGKQRIERRWSRDGTLPNTSDAVEMSGNGEVMEVFGMDRRQILLFGAGHVGQALILALAPHPFGILWVDSRPEAFPSISPEQVRFLHTLEPVGALRDAPSGSFVVVMTHSHALDLQIVESALDAERFGYVGLIGSATKRARFVKRLSEAGLSGAAIGALVCPVGIEGVRSKRPAAIAAAVTVQLLSRDEALRSAAASCAPSAQLEDSLENEA